MLALLLSLMLNLSLKVRPVIALAPTDVHIEARIEPEKPNRAFCVSAGLNGQEVRRTCGPLDGDQDSLLHVVEWRDFVESGDYTIELVVLGQDGKVLGTQTEIMHLR